MKKRIVILILFFLLPVLVYSVTENGITITKLSVEPVPFNERRDPAADSPYNAFDGDIKTSALYSDFTMEFSKPVNIDQIKIMNGNSSRKDLFKKYNRIRDIEITLYTITVESEKKIQVKKKKNKKTITDKKVDKNNPVKNNEKNKEENKEENIKDPNDRIEPDKNKNKKNEKKESVTPQKVVESDTPVRSDDYQMDGAKLYFAASETVIDTAEKTVIDSQTVKEKPVTIENKNSEQLIKKDEKKTALEKKKKVENKKAVSVKPEKKKNQKTKTTVKQSSVKKPISGKTKLNKKSPEKPKLKKDATSEKDKTSNKNIIEIVDSKKDKPLKKKSTVIDNKSKVIKDNEKSPGKIQQGKKKKIKHKKPVKKTTKKTVDKKNKTEKKVSNDKSGNKIVDSKGNKGKLPAGNKPLTEDIKNVKPEIKNKDIKKEQVKPAKEDVVKKMTGIVRIENDKDGRVLVYAALKDSTDFQSINLKGKYSVTKIDFRTRDDEYYTGTEPDSSGITEISFYNNGKKIPVQNIDAMNKSYKERYTRNLISSISGETFIMYENNEVVLRMIFKENGNIEYYDRFKCSKKGNADCTSESMPDKWKITDGKLFMKYEGKKFLGNYTTWREWKYELDSQNDMLSDTDRFEAPRWMKIYYNSDKGFTGKYLDLIRSDKEVWTE